jgi:ketosteroid isomerase-like protein
MGFLHDDIVYLVNVDDLQVPYAMSALGKNDADERLSFLIHTFVVERFSLEKLVHEADHSWSVVHGIYRHRVTGEVLETKLRFKARLTDAKITREWKKRSTQTTSRHSSALSSTCSRLKSWDSYLVSRLYCSMSDFDASPDLASVVAQCFDSCFLFDRMHERNSWLPTSCCPHNDM